MGSHVSSFCEKFSVRMVVAVAASLQRSFGCLLMIRNRVVRLVLMENMEILSQERVTFNFNSVL